MPQSSPRCGKTPHGSRNTFWDARIGLARIKRRRNETQKQADALTRIRETARLPRRGRGGRIESAEAAHARDAMDLAIAGRTGNPPASRPGLGQGGKGRLPPSGRSPAPSPRPTGRFIRCVDNLVAVIMPARSRLSGPPPGSPGTGSIIKAPGSDAASTFSGN